MEAGNRFSIENIGRVKRAALELQGITVVAGYNGTGKSTVSKALYVAMDINSSLPQKAFLQRQKSIDKVVREWLDMYTLFEWRGDARIEVAFRREVKRLREGSAATGMKERLAELMLRCGMTDIPEAAGDELLDRLQEIWKRNSSYYEEYAIQEILNDVFSNQMNTIGRNTEGRIELHTGSCDVYTAVDGNRISAHSFKRSSMDMDRAVYITTSDLMDAVGAAKRVFMGRRQDYINASLINMLLSEPRQKEFTAEEYAAKQRQQEQLSAILDQVVNGNIRMEQGRLIYHDNWCDGNVELSNIASGMKLFVILKRLIENGVLLKYNTLIIDEPENNLHPEWQLKLAELLVLMHEKMGIRIYCNSHSPYFIRAIEYYANEYDMLTESRFYMTGPAAGDLGMYECEDVTEDLGRVFDTLAGPFNRII